MVRRRPRFLDVPSRATAERRPGLRCRLDLVRNVDVALEHRLRGASILDAVSHQATFLGNYREAANLARAARMGTETAGSPSASAHFYAMEARALARLGGEGGVRSGHVGSGEGVRAPQSGR